MSQLYPSSALSPATPPKLNWVWDCGDGGLAGLGTALRPATRSGECSAVQCSAVHLDHSLH